MHLLFFLLLAVLPGSELVGQTPDPCAEAETYGLYQVEIIAFLHKQKAAALTTALQAETTALQAETTALQAEPARRDFSQPSAENLWLHEAIYLPANIRALTPAWEDAPRPQNIQQLTAVMESVEHRPIVHFIHGHATPALNDFAFWLGNVRRYHSTDRNLEAIENPETLSRYWPYIKPLTLELDTGDDSQGRPQDDAAPTTCPAPDAAANDAVQYMLRQVAGPELRLQAEADAIAARKNYEVLLHQAWRQPVLPIGQGAPILVQQNIKAAESPWLVGVINVGTELFLSAEVTLWYSDDYLRALTTIPTADANPSADQQSDAPNSNRLAYIELNTPVRLREDERYYIDHPYLGVLMMISPYSPPQTLAPEVPGDGVGQETIEQDAF